MDMNPNRRSIHPSEKHPFVVQSENGSDIGDGWTDHEAFSCAVAADDAAERIAAVLANEYEPGCFSVRVDRVGSFEVRRKEGSGWVGVGDFDREQAAIDEATRLNAFESMETDIVETDIGQIHHYPRLERVEPTPDGSGRWVVEIWRAGAFVGCLVGKGGAGFDGQTGCGVHIVRDPVADDRTMSVDDVAVFECRSTAAIAAQCVDDGQAIVVEFEPA